MADDTKLKMTSKDITDDTLNQLKQLLPQAFKEGKVDFDLLRQSLGDFTETEKEHYGLSWAGKSDAIRSLQLASDGTLRPDRKGSVEFDKTENLIIEGDNLETLKLMQKAYFGKVKMIYIDPPYNTGHDFVYKDNFNENLSNYLKYTGQSNGDTGEVYTTNTDSSGRYHSNWLNMMYPRLYLARNLLKDNGVVFVSIDDNEVANLRLMMDEIFGEENFVGQIIREAIKGGSQSKNIRECHDYVLSYAKNINCLQFSGIEQDGVELNLKDEKGNYAKGRELNKWGAGSRREDAPGMWYPIIGPNKEEVYPIRNDGTEGRWRLGKTKLKKLVADDDVIFEKREDGTYIVYEKIRDDSPRIKQFTTLFKDKYINAKGTESIKKLFQLEKSYFDYAKPVELIYDLILMSDTKDDDIILDFFAGSGTTAQAVMELNAEDEGNRKFILVQLPEKVEEKSEAYKAGYKTISEITRERVRRVIDKIKKEHKGKLDFNGEIDLGFKSFRLDSSNFKLWDGKSAVDMSDEELANTIKGFAENLIENRDDEDRLYEITMKIGIPLAEKQEKLTLNGQTVYSYPNQGLLICVEEEIKEKTLSEMIDKDPEHIICLDNAFKGNASLKTNVKVQMEQKNKKFNTV